MFLFITFCVLCVCTSFQESLASSSEGCYWREYTGKIPEDAIVGGEDISGQKIYIGQAYFHNIGLMVAPIYPGKKEVHFHFAYEAYTVDSHIKILCGKQDNFYWAPTTTKSMHEFMIGKHGVLGGHYEHHGEYNIGRTVIDGETKIGRIHTYEPKPDIDVSHKGSEKILNVFEILLYKKKTADVKEQ